MKAVCLLIVMVLLATLVLTALGTAIGIGAGTLLAHWLPLSLFQASALAIGATIAVTLVVHVVTTMVHFQMEHTGEDEDFGWELDEEADGAPVFAEPAPAKIGRNAPCPCGSGKKYKNCCGKSAAT